MKLYNEGDKSKALCSHCEGLVNVTFKYRDMPFSDGIGCAKNILARVCDDCGEVVSIPQQSIPSIKNSRARSIMPVEANVPATLVDAINVAAHSIDADFSGEFKKMALWFFIRSYAAGKIDSEDLKSRYHSNTAVFGSVKARLSFKVSSVMYSDLEKVAELFHENKTEVLKLAAFDFYDKIVEKKDKSTILKLKDIAYLT
jgi:hypothetical protein